MFLLSFLHHITSGFNHNSMLHDLNKHASLVKLDCLKHYKMCFIDSVLFLNKRCFASTLFVNVPIEIIFAV